MNNVVSKISITTLVSLVVFVSSFTQGFADDIEIYNRLQIEPNVVFILDQSESMLQLVGSTGKTRDEIVKEAFSRVMSEPYNNLNVGFMDYGRNNGAGVDLPVSDVNDLARNVEPGVVSSTETYAELLARFANNLEGPQNNAKTALVEALLEAAKYYRGDVIDNLSQGIGNQGTWNDGQSRYTGGSWRAAGPRTLTTGATSSVAGSNCHAAGSPPGAPHSQCNNPYPGSCRNLSANSGTYQACTGGYSCTQYDVTGTECVTSVCNGYTTRNWSHPAYTRCRETSSTTAKQYISPIQTACTENFIVLLSDGAPTILGNHEKTSIQGFAGTSSCQDLSTLGFSDPSILSKGECGPDLTKAISTRDISTSIPGVQTVNTYTVGFDLGAGANEAKSYLELLASEGNGQFFDASGGSAGVDGLVTIFQNIFNSITQKPRTITRAAVPLDVETLLGNRSEVYLSMFSDRPNEPRWQGNVKGYSFDPVNLLVGLDGNPAYDSNGDFSTASRSYWSLAPDGGSIGNGGLADLITNSGRNAKTDNGSGTFVDLTASNFDDSDLSLFGLTSTGNSTTDHTRVDNLINWARGEDVFDEDNDSSTTDDRHFVGDILHSVPEIAQYDFDSDGTVDKRVLYVMTNEGYLHAVDVTSNTTATELFAYMPQALLPNLDALQRNISGAGKVYGLDGHLVLHQEGGVLNTDGRKTLYFGMRRGGRNYYAMDVTDDPANPANPSLNWVIQGGSGDFKELGQTWSQPIVANVLHNGSKKEVLIFGGGYDTNKDSSYSADSVGRAIYIVDAATGAKLWSAGPSSSLDTHDLTLAINDSVAGDVQDIDFDFDGIVDRLYFADTGGHLWRVDFKGDLNTAVAGPSTGADVFSGYMLAELHGTGAANERRFYNRPSVARTGLGKLAITIGSGYRAHPLDSGVQDRLYMVLDSHATKGNIPNPSPSAITESGMTNITNFLTLETDGDNTNNIVSPFSFGASDGWYYDLSTDEKVLNAAAIISGEVFFATYIPPTSACSNVPDGARLFVIGLDGTPTRDLDGVVTNGQEISALLTTNGIPAEFSVISQITKTACENDPTLPECDVCNDSPGTAACCNIFPSHPSCGQSKSCEGGSASLVTGSKKLDLSTDRCIQERFWTNKP